MKQYSKSGVPQMVEIELDPTNPESGPGTVRIDGVPIHNIAGIWVETDKEDKDIGTTYVTIRINVLSQVFILKTGRC